MIIEVKSKFLVAFGAFPPPMYFAVVATLIVPISYLFTEYYWHVYSPLRVTAIELNALSLS